MDNAKQQLVERLNTATNILVSVSRDPSVDQLAACLGLTLLLNKLGKHATAVFSGQVPSTIEFLEPEDTLEKNTDSLRDFIIALDKTKADKLRYKVEDDLVRIFITPYKTSISQADLEFSQGDFNVDMVVALGVSKQEDLDDAITAHGRILHDATLTSINLQPEGDGLGSINWNDPHASSLCELVAELVKGLGQNLLDGQIATALLTGVVAETARFSNEKTTATTMSVSAELMAAGANQQLIASKLDEPLAVPAGGSTPPDEPSEPDDSDAPQPDKPEEPTDGDGTLEIEHSDDEEAPEPDSDNVPDAVEAVAEEPAVEPEASLPPVEPSAAEEAPAETALPSTSKLIVEPPTLGGQLTANSQPEAYDPSTDPLSLPAIEQHLLSHDGAAEAAALPPEPFLNAPVPPSEPVTSEPSEPQPAVTEATEPAPAEQSIVPPPKHTSPALMTGFTPPPPAWVPPSADALNFATPSEPALAPSPAPLGVADPQTAHNIDAVVANDSPSAPPPSESAARDEVLKALQSSEPAPEAIQALNAQPMVDHINNPEPETVISSHERVLTPPPAPETNLAAALEAEVAAESSAGQAPATPDFSESLPQIIPPVPPAPTATPAPGLNLPSVDAPAATPTEEPNDGTPKPPPVPPPMNFSSQPPIPFHFGNTTEPPKQ